MKKRVLAIGLCGLFMLALGASPRYLEELRIGGGHGDTDGGADFDKAGNINTDGTISCGGVTVEQGQISAEGGAFAQLAGREILEAGVDDTVPGALHVYGGSGTSSGSIFFHTAEAYDYTVDYWEWSSGVLGVLQLCGYGGMYNPGMIAQFNALAGLFSLNYDTAIWGGGLEVGREGADAVQGTISVFNNNTGTGPGYLQFYSCNGTPSYLFAANDGTGLRVSSSAPLSNTDGGWLTSEKFKRADSTSDAVDLATSEVAGLLPANKVGSGITDPQINDNLTVWSGSINDTPIGASTPSTAKFSRLIMTGVLSQANIIEWTADDQSPSVAAGNVFRVPATWTAGHNVTSLDDGVEGQRIVVIGGDCDCTIPDAGNFRLEGSWTGCSPDTLELIYDGLLWIEITRTNS